MTEQSKQMLDWLKSHLETTPIDEVVSGLRDANKGVFGGISMITDPQKHLEETLAKCLEVVAPFVATKVYEFIYCDCIHESAFCTISIHRTREGAERAMKKHKAKWMREERKLYRDEPAEYRKKMVKMSLSWTRWDIVETELKP